MNIFITGACGYVGTVLSKVLADEGQIVTAFDTQWFGNHLPSHPNINVVKGDTRDIADHSLDGIDVVIHLANIANDPAVDLNLNLSWEVNVLATQQLAERASRAGVGQFIFASSGSVYGIKEEMDVTEELELLPLSAYNKTKMVAERVLLSYQSKMQVHCIRPATVCGYSPRMRFDVSVNMLTLQALKNKKMTVFGGAQTRPNIHINDMVRVYQHFLSHPNLPSDCYNAGFENMAIIDIAELIGTKIHSDIEITQTNDLRSYRQNSDKLLSTGFQQKYFVCDAVDEIAALYAAGSLNDDEKCYTVSWMKKLEV
jgi:nucleoside-diphosphate-sugar epimerase